MLSYHTYGVFQGYKHQKAYIIAEGPMESTVRNMWKVVYDRKCGAVVMLSKLVEDGMVSLIMFAINHQRQFLFKMINSNTSSLCLVCFLEEECLVSFVLSAGEQCAVLASCCW